jgi:hypothetical protein
MTLCTPADTTASAASIERATAWIEQHCRRSFHARDRITETHGAGTRIRVRNPPIRALHAPATDYEVANARTGVLVKDCCPSPGTPVHVVYDGGFDTIPPDVVRACAQLAEAFDHDAGLPPWRVVEALAPYRLPPR